MDTAATTAQEQQYIGTIKVEGLFGKFDHTVTLKEGGLTILYGENGVGKTTLFKLIYHGLKACGGRMRFEKKYLKMILFDKMTILDQDDNEMYCIWKGAVSKQVQGNEFIKTYHTASEFNELNEGGKQDVLSNYCGAIFNNLTHEVEANYSIDNWEEEIKNTRTNGILTYEDFIKKYQHTVYDIELTKGKIDTYYYTHPHLISSSRISNDSETTITKIAKDLLILITNTETSFETKIKELSSSQNRRIFESQVSTNVEESKLEEQLKELQLKIDQLQQVGFLYKEETPITSIPDQLSDIAKAIFAINTSDYLEALTVFDDFYPKLVLFLDIINNRRFSHKKVSINKIEGFTVRDDEGKLIPLYNLSSGEQHELVLIYELLFGHKSKQNKLFLIDEPEISLHLLWQQAFVKDMQEIIKLTGIQIITATHAPGIINGNWDLTVNLKYPEPKANSASGEKEETNG